MATEILMPALSPTMKQGNLMNWLKKEGDIIAAGEVIAEIETDKAIMELEAVDEGTIAKIVITAGTNNVNVNDLIAIVAEKGENTQDAINQIQNKATKHNINILESTDKIIEENVEIKLQEDKLKKIFISPLAKRIANQKSIDVTKIQGSGPKGRIVKSDIENIKSSKSFKDNLLVSRSSQDVIVPVSNMRKVIAERLVTSKQQVPHFYLEVECIVDNLLDYRKKINSSAKCDNNGKVEFKISINDFLIKASALALRQHPNINSAWHEDKIIQFSDVDISIAVAIEGGLMTPIIKNADQKGLIRISTEVKELIKKAKTQKLKPEEYIGGTFSISNLGMYSIRSFHAIINPPQSSILAISNIKAMPFFKNDQVWEKKEIMNLSLSCDHRVIDGVTAANFLNTLKKFVENIPLMLCY